MRQNIEEILVFTALVTAALAVLALATTMLAQGGLLAGLMFMFTGATILGACIHVAFSSLEQVGICGREECH